ncbi:hypothetical protein KQX54_021223 [Cotesia glomerata]|uniref:Uncharacterized protein n=1 Tax=Cotesia glomerata TaxID=32391 RepID=A0AAV7I233_COTGL|nr:hypothetical protein KQX54_021223 [Cotesia glomerata]
MCRYIFIECVLKPGARSQEEKYKIYPGDEWPLKTLEHRQATVVPYSDIYGRARFPLRRLLGHAAALNKYPGVIGSETVGRVPFFPFHPGYYSPLFLLLDGVHSTLRYSVDSPWTTRPRDPGTLARKGVLYDSGTCIGDCRTLARYGRKKESEEVNKISRL